MLWSAGDPQLTLANASVYLEAFGHVAIAWIWLEQALALRTTKERRFLRRQAQAARYFFQWELPKVDAQLDLLASLDAPRWTCRTLSSDSTHLATKCDRHMADKKFSTSRQDRAGHRRFARAGPADGRSAGRATAPGS